MSTPEPLVALKQIHKRFGSKTVLAGVDLELHRGEALAVVGPSGTGKSTILRLICGLLAPDQGTVLVGGAPAESLGPANVVQVGMVFQQAALFDSLTVEENVGFRLYQKGKLPAPKIRKLVAETLAKVGLKDIEDLYPASLSGGMRKRVSFARAILEDPSEQNEQLQILLFDEPTAGLDPVASTVIEDLIRDLGRGNIAAYVVVTHQHSTIRRTADRLILLHQGLIQWQGSVLDIEQSENPYVQQFFSGATQGPIQ